MLVAADILFILMFNSKNKEVSNMVSKSFNRISY